MMMMKKIRLGIVLFLAVLIPINGLAQERRFKVTFYCACAICTGKYSPSRGGPGLTALGNQPLPFRTVAVGDPNLLGRWIYFEDLGGWVFASDTGQPCGNQVTGGRSVQPGKVAKQGGSVGARRLWAVPSRKEQDAYRPPISAPCVSRDQVDVFVGAANMHQAALRLGVQEWVGKVLDTQVKDSVYLFLRGSER